MSAPGTGTTPSQAYARGAARGDWQDDPAQHPALVELDRIHSQLLATARDGGLFGRLFKSRPEAVKGLYYWGEVGRGKTFLVDLFYDGLPIGEKYRTHFHRFMRNVHERLREHAVAAAAVVKQEGKPNDMIARVEADPAFGLTREEIEAELSPEAFTGRSAEQVTEFLRDVIQPVLDANAEDVGQHVELNV